MSDKDISARERRRKRRIRNQILAYVSLIVIIGGLAAGAFFGVRKVMQVMDDRKQAEEMAEELVRLQEEAQEEAQTAAEEEESTAPEYSADDLLDEVVTYAMEGMSIEDKAAQMFFITPEALTDVGTVTQGGDKTKERLAQYPVGGIIYFNKNIKSAEQFAEMTAFVKNESKRVPFLGVDEEGGSVARIADSPIQVEKTAPAAEIGASNDTQMAYDAGNAIGSYLISNGLNFDFAPVADVSPEAEHKVLKDRTFGSDSTLVGEMAAQMALGLQDAGVSACLKHFPGLGSVETDTHDAKSVSDRTLEQLRAEEFVPFQTGIAAGVDSVMVSHLSVPSVIGDETPSSLSKVMITDILRNELGYDGIVITDALNMKAITDNYSSKEAAVMAVQAGADMLLMPEQFEEAYQAVVDAVKDGTISEERLDESVKRIFRVKYRSTIVTQ